MGVVRENTKAADIDRLSDEELLGQVSYAFLLLFYM